jgi:hypothetical protein
MSGKKLIFMVLVLSLSILILVQFIFCATFIYQKKELKASIKAEMEQEYGLVPVETDLEALETLPDGIAAVTLNIPEDVSTALGSENEVNLTIQLSAYVNEKFSGVTQASYIDNTFSANDQKVEFQLVLNDSAVTPIRIIYQKADNTLDIRTIAEIEAEAKAKAEAEAAAKAEAESKAKAESEAAAKAEAESKAKAESEAAAKAEAESKAKAESEAAAKAQTQ